MFNATPGQRCAPLLLVHYPRTFFYSGQTNLPILYTTENSFLIDMSRCISTTFKFNIFFYLLPFIILQNDRQLEI